MNPHALENLHVRLGSPAWFWPLVLFVIFVLLVVGSSIEGPGNA